MGATSATLELVIQLKGDAEKQFANLEVDIKQVSKAAKEAGAAVEATGGLASKAGGLLRDAFAFATGGLLEKGFEGIAGAVVGGLQSIIGESSEAAEGQARLAAALESTHGKAGVTADAANDLAGSLQLVTKFTDDQVLASENMLLTFTNISSSVFPQATEATLNMAQAFKTDASQAAVQLGKALNDPIAGISALSRVGVTFTQAQKDQIAAMMQAGDVAGAQTVILKELETEFGGAARAAGDTFPGQLAILSHRFDDLKQSLGDALMPALQSLVATLNSPQVQAGLEAAVQGLAAGLQTVLPIIGQVAATAFDLAGTLSGPLTFALQNLIPILATIAVLSLPAMVSALGALVAACGTASIAVSGFTATLIAGGGLTEALAVLAGGGGLLATLAGGIAALVTPLGLVVVAVGALALAWNTDFLGMRTTFEPWVQSVADGLADVQAKLGHDLRAALGQSTADWDSAMAANERRTKIMAADINTDLEGVRDSWDQSGAMITASTQQHGQATVAATQGVWAAIAQTTTQTAQQVVDAVSQAGALQAQGYVNNMVKAYGTGQPAVDAYLAFLIKRHDLGDALAIMGRNSAIKFLNALVLPVATGLEKMAASFASIPVLKGLPGMDAFVGSFRTASEAIVAQLGKATGQWQGFTSTFHAEIPKIEADHKKVGKSAADLAAKQDAAARAITAAQETIIRALATAGQQTGPGAGGIGQSLVTLMGVLKDKIPADMGFVKDAIVNTLAQANSGAAPSVQALHDRIVGLLQQLTHSTDQETRLMAQAALENLGDGMAQAAAKATAALTKSFDEQGKAAADAVSKQLETQQAQRDIQEGMVKDAEKNYQAYADAVNKGYQQAGDAMAAAVTQQLEDQQRARDAAAAQAQAAQQLPSALEPALLALQQHTKSALDVLSSLAPLATQAAAAGMPGLAQVIAQYMDQARDGVAVDGQAMYQSLLGYLQQMAQSGDSILSTFAQNAIQHLQLAAQIQAAQQSLVPFQAAADAAAAHVAAMNTAVQDAQKGYSDLQGQVSAAKQAIADFARAPLQGEGAFAQAMHANEQAVARVRLQMLDLQRAGVSSSDPRAQALQRQLDRLQQEADRARLQNQLTIGDQRFNLEQQANTTPEVSYTAAQQGIAAAKDQVAQLTPQLQAAQDRLTALTREQAAAQEASQAAAAALQAQQAAVQALTQQLQNGQPVAAAYTAAMAQTAQSTAQFATDTAAGLAPVGPAFDALFGTAGDQAGPANILNKLFAHQDTAFFAALDKQTNDRMDGYVAGTWASKLQNLDDRISDGLDTIKNTALTAAQAIGESLVQGIQGPIDAAVSSIAQSAANAVNAAIEAARAAAGNPHSPSPTMAAKVGAPLAQGVVVPMQQAQSAAAQAGAGLSNAAISGAAVAGLPSAPVPAGGGGITINVTGPSMADLNFWRSVARLISIAVNERPGQQLALTKAQAAGTTT